MHLASEVFIFSGISCLLKYDHDRDAVNSLKTQVWMVVTPFMLVPFYAAEKSILGHP